MNTPKFIVFEGIDGSGKSTQVKILCEYCRDMNIPHSFLREPTDGEHGMEIRRVLSGESLPPVDKQIELFINDRKDDTVRNILPSLKKGKHVIMDRYYFSNAAYQGTSAAGWRTILEQNIKERFPVPDRVYFIDIPPSEALRRIEIRGGGEKELFEREDFLAGVRKRFLDMADDTFLVIDGMKKTEIVSAVIQKDFLSIISRK